jgi:hypothetical protein
MPDMQAGLVCRCVSEAQIEGGMSPLPGVKKGNRFARQVAAYLGTEPRTLNGTLDRGDLVHPTWTVEIKCPGRGQPLNLSAAMNEAKIEATHAGTDRWCVISRRTGHPLDEAFFTIPLWIAKKHVADLDRLIQLELPNAGTIDVPTKGVL